MKLSLTLANRGILFGLTSAAELLRMSEVADSSGVIYGVYVGDSLLAIPRLESLTLLAAIAARTKLVRLGTACMSSFTLRPTSVSADNRCRW